MNKTVKILLAGIILVIAVQGVQAQTFKEYKKNEQEKFNRFKTEQQQQIKQLQQDYNAYVKKADEQFVRFLEQQWKDFNAFKGEKQPLSPKPVVIPRYKPVNGNINGLPRKEIPVALPALTPFLIPPPAIPVVLKTQPETKPEPRVEINFYGTLLRFPEVKNIPHLSPSVLSRRSVSNWWKNCSKTGYTRLVNQLLSTKNRLSLNDWAYFMLVRQTAGKVAGENPDNKKLFTWFLMIRSGYNIKIAMADKNIYLLFPSSQDIYGMDYLRINDERYYFTENIGTKTFQTYDFIFPGANRKIDFNILQPLNIGNKVIKKQVSFTYQGKRYSFPVLLDASNLSFMKNYPVTSLNVFFNAAMSQVTKQSLAEALMPLLANRNKEDALDFLLAFVQHAFQYETDRQQFGREKFFFPEEVFYYKASDCEDRAALFSYLVKNQLHLQVVGLEYKDHVATAVHLGQGTPGDYLVYQHEKYTIADPTYINAPLGMAMPQYKNSRPQIIKTGNKPYLASLTGELWRMTEKKGGFRGSNLTDAQIDDNGNCYLAGYYTKGLKLGNRQWNAPNGKREAFIVKYNKEKKVVWARNLQADSMATAFALTLDDKGDPVVAGSFSGKLSAGGHTLKTIKNNPDVFAAAYDASGNVQWLQKAGLDTVNKANFLTYVVHIAPNGRRLNTRLYLENKAAVSNGIFYRHNIFDIIGETNNTTGFNVQKASFGSENNFTVVDYLLKENETLINQNVNKSIAGLFAVIKLIRLGGMVISGKEAQQAIDRYNPQFQHTSPHIYQNIGKVVFLKNNSGIVRIMTNNKKAVLFDKLRVQNNAALKIVPLENGNRQIDVMSGITVGKLFVWYNLNFVRLLSHSGDLLFDYDSDHTRKTLNLKKDILY